jgi:DNA-binding NarL/FixJ family response regulator
VKGLSGELGISFLAQSKLGNFAGRVLMVTSGMSNAEIFRAIEDGVAGIFLKNSPLAELIQAISRVIKGETWIDPSVAKALIRTVHHASEPMTNETISGRERDVLRGILEGLSNKEVSVRLGLSESTVKASLQQLFARTGVRTRSQLVRIAVEKHSTDWLG